jgi:hypothetical protein
MELDWALWFAPISLLAMVIAVPFFLLTHSRAPVRVPVRMTEQVRRSR